VSDEQGARVAGEGWLRVFEQMPADLARVLEHDRVGVILGQDRRGSWVVPVEQEGTNVVRRTRVVLEFATSSLHAPLPYKSCRIHRNKRVLS